MGHVQSRVAELDKEARPPPTQQSHRGAGAEAGGETPVDSQAAELPVAQPEPDTALAPEAPHVRFLDCHAPSDHLHFCILSANESRTIANVEPPSQGDPDAKPPTAADLGIEAAVMVGGTDLAEEEGGKGLQFESAREFKGKAKELRAKLRAGSTLVGGKGGVFGGRKGPALTPVFSLEHGGRAAVHRALEKLPSFMFANTPPEAVREAQAKPLHSRVVARPRSVSPLTPPQRVRCMREEIEWIEQHNSTAFPNFSAGQGRSPSPRRAASSPPS